MRQLNVIPADDKPGALEILKNLLTDTEMVNVVEVTDWANKEESLLQKKT